MRIIGSTFQNTRRSHALTTNAGGGGAVPGQVTGVSVGPATANSMPISWSAATNLPTDYYPQYSLAGANSWTTFNDGVSTVTNTVITGLTSSTSYDFRVSALNVFGQGLPSSIVTASTSAVGMYGATADQGEIDDPTVIGTTYSSGTTYSEGDMVTDSVDWYYSRSSGNVGNLLSNNTFWFKISKFFYVDFTNGNDSNTGSTSPATAKSAPIKTVFKVWDYLDNSGGTVAQTSAKTMVLFKRGDVYLGSCTINTECLIGAWGSTLSARPEIQFENNTGRYFTGLVFDIQAGGSGSIIRNLRINARYCMHFGYTTGTGTMVDGDRVHRQSDGLRVGTVRGNPANGRITIQFDDPLDANQGANLVSGNIVETLDGLKNITIGPSVNGTQVSGIATSTTNVRIINCEVFNAVGNGVGSGNGTRNNASNFYVYNCIIHDTCKWGGAGAGMQGGWGNGIKILHCTAYNNGQSNIFSHNFYLDDLDNCEFAYNWCYVTGAYGNHGLVVHGQCDSLWVHDNLIEYSQSGIGINDGYSDIAHGGWYEEFSNCVIERNIMRHLGTYNGTGLVIDAAAMTNGVWRNNICYNNKGVISLSTNKHTADKAFSANVTFEYNTFISDTTIGSGDYFFKIQANNGVACTGVVVKNNLIESQRTNLATFSTDATTPAANVSLVNNLIYNITGYTSIIRWVNVAYTLSSWSGTPGINSNSTNATTTNYGGVFTNKSIWDLTLPGGSPAKGVAVFDSAILTDFAGTTRSVTTPSAGAYE